MDSSPLCRCGLVGKDVFCNCQVSIGCCCLPFKFMPLTLVVHCNQCIHVFSLGSHFDTLNRALSDTSLLTPAPTISLLMPTPSEPNCHSRFGLKSTVSLQAHWRGCFLQLPDLHQVPLPSIQTHKIIVLSSLTVGPLVPIVSDVFSLGSHFDMLNRAPSTTSLICLDVHLF